MVHLMNMNGLTDSDADIKFVLKGEGNLLSLLVPSEGLARFWKDKARSDENWEIFKSVYQKELQEDCKVAGLDLLEFYSKAGKKVAVGCECREPDKCVRSLIAEALAARKVELFLE